MENPSDGIATSKLCIESKKYLSRLLIGKTGINPDFLTWDLLLTEKLYLDFFLETGKESLEQLIGARVEWNRLLKENKLKDAIEQKIIQLESKNKQQKYLEFKKQQADLYYKKRGWVSIGLLVTLSIAYFYTLPLLGIATILVSVLYLAVVVSLICCSIIPAFVGERLTDPEWYKEYSIEKEKNDSEENQQTVTNPTTTQNKSTELDQRRTLETPTTSNGNISKKPESTHYSLFFKEKIINCSKNSSTDLTISITSKFI